jgi:hypothetical protein
LERGRRGSRKWLCSASRSAKYGEQQRKHTRWSVFVLGSLSMASMVDATDRERDQ